MCARGYSLALMVFLAHTHIHTHTHALSLFSLSRLYVYSIHFAHRVTDYRRA